MSGERQDLGKQPELLLVPNARMPLPAAVDHRKAGGGTQVNRELIGSLLVLARLVEPFED